MDIRLKSNKYIIKIILLISILIASIGLCMLYPKIQKDSKMFEYNVFESKSYFLRDIVKTSYTLYYKIEKDNDSDTLKPSDLLLDTREFTGTEDNIYNYKKMFDEKINNWNDDLNDRLKNLDYYAINKENEESKNKSKHKLISLIEPNKVYKEIDKIKDAYRFYMVIDYDSKGNLSIPTIYNGNKSVILNEIENLQGKEDIFGSYALNGLNIKPIKNMTYIYAVPKALIGQDNISYAINNAEIDAYSKASMIFINISLLFIIFISLIIPYKEIKDISLFKKICKLPIELLIIIIFLVIAFIYNSSEIIMTSSIKGELINFTQIKISEEVKSIITYLLNIIYFSLCFSVISMGIFTIKYIYKVGFKSYIKENSLLVKTINYIKHHIRKIYNELTDFDLKNKNNSKLIILLILNLVIIAMMCFMWIFGVIFAVIYTIVLFILIRRKYKKINNDYNNLLKLTSEIGKGNLDINVDEDLGIFNSIKYEVSNIQKGFKNAVEEEVKSQKMKTELISNVSHDLKTPLTSIITYIDLLKDKSLTNENRNDYLEVLDRKSQRLKDLIEDLFEVSKATSGNINLNLVDIDIVSLMKQTLLELDDRIEESNLIIKKNISNDKVVLRLDSQRMYRVFENLIINITKYAMKGTRVYIDILDEEERVSISFKNIAEEEITYDVKEITERFVRGDKSRNTEGSGLGLAIAKSFIELQGGKFNVNIDGDLFKVIITFEK